MNSIEKRRNNGIELDRRPSVKEALIPVIPKIVFQPVFVLSICHVLIVIVNSIHHFPLIRNLSKISQRQFHQRRRSMTKRQRRCRLVDRILIFLRALNPSNDDNADDISLLTRVNHRTFMSSANWISPLLNAILFRHRSRWQRDDERFSSGTNITIVLFSLPTIPRCSSRSLGAIKFDCWDGSANRHFSFRKKTTDRWDFFLKHV